MYDDSAHPDDLFFIEKCLSGDEESIRALQETYGPELKSFLVGVGGGAGETSEVVLNLWADGLMGTSKRGPVFERYIGKSSLKTWLKTVALNSLLDLKRKTTRRREAHLEDDASVAESIAEEQRPFDLLETNLLQLMRASLELALSRCSDEEFVMLQLRFYDDLQVLEIARMWQIPKNSTPRISRKLNEICEQIARRTLENIRVIDPWLELTWPDFLEMSRSAHRSILGTDEPEE